MSQSLSTDELISTKELVWLFHIIGGETTIAFRSANLAFTTFLLYFALIVDSLCSLVCQKHPGYFTQYNFKYPSQVIMGPVNTISTGYRIFLRPIHYPITKHGSQSRSARRACREKSSGQKGLNLAVESVNIEYIIKFGNKIGNSLASLVCNTLMVVQALQPSLLLAAAWLVTSKVVLPVMYRVDVFF